MMSMGWRYFDIRDGNGTMFAAIEVGDVDPDECLRELTESHPEVADTDSLSFVSPRSLLLGPQSADPESLAIFGQARSLLLWHSLSRFCGVCGNATGMYDAGMKRRCLSCDARVYPRTDPVVIVDPGESVEEAVRREVLEESGVAVGRVRIFASQPWPIGRGTFGQLMIGCLAMASSESGELPAVHVNTSELEHAEWVHRDELVAVLDSDDRQTSRFWVPPPFAIANHLLREWVKQIDAAT